MRSKRGGLAIHMIISSHQVIIKSLMYFTCRLLTEYHGDGCHVLYHVTDVISHAWPARRELPELGH